MRRVESSWDFRRRSSPENSRADSGPAAWRTGSLRKSKVERNTFKMSAMNTSKLQHDLTEFTGKRILVSGGTKGIGEAIVNRLLRGGGIVLATARTSPAGGNPRQFIQADVST